MLNPLVPTLGDVVLALVALLLVVGVIVVVIVTIVRRSRPARQSGPGAHTDRAVTSHRSPEARLTEAQELHRRGLLTADELDEIRQRVLADL